MEGPPITPSTIGRVSARAGLLFGLLGLVAWGTGKPFIFPSLGPTAFVLSVQSQADHASAWVVVGSHAWGTLAGLASYHLLASGGTLMILQTPMSEVGGLLAASGTVAMLLTSALMIGTRSVHPPACATTLIVSLGLLPTVREGALIIAAVALLYGLSWGWQKLAPEASTLEAGR